MPKEITHWLIAQQAAAAIKGTALGDVASEFPNCVQLGAILHDAPYYARDRRWKQSMLYFADVLHGRGTDTFAAIHSLTRAANLAQSPGPIRAMIIGMLTHIAADSCFHPLVYHETGNYYDPDPKQRTRAVQLHRRFETMLDVYLAGTLKNIKNFSLKHILRCCELQVPMLLRDAFKPLETEYTCPQLPNALLHSLKVFSRMQGLYTNYLITNILEALHIILPHTVREIAALFYMPGCVKQAPTLHGPRTMPNPETGALQEITILGLYNKAIEQSISLCRELEPGIMGAAPYKPPLQNYSPDIAMLPEQNTGA